MLPWGCWHGADWALCLPQRVPPQPVPSLEKGSIVLNEPHPSTISSSAGCVVAIHSALTGSRNRGVAMSHLCERKGQLECGGPRPGLSCPCPPRAQRGSAEPKSWFSQGYPKVVSLPGQPKMPVVAGWQHDFAQRAQVPILVPPLTWNRLGYVVPYLS